MTDKNRRDRNFRPRLAPCKKCGQDFLKTASARVYCDACQKVRVEERKEEQRQMRIEHARQRKEQEARAILSVQIRPPIRDLKPAEIEEDPNAHVCAVSCLCEYGINGFKHGCNYQTITGELRTSGGRHLIKDGKCDLYRRRKKRRKTGWEATRDRELEEKYG